MPLGVEGFVYGDLYDPAKLSQLHQEFDTRFASWAPELHARFRVYRDCRGEGMSPTDVSDALLAAAPFVGRFIEELFGVEQELAAFRAEVRTSDPVWRFRKDFVKKRVLRPDAGKAWTRGEAAAALVAKAALQTTTPVPIGATTDEELTIASAASQLLDLDDVARKAAKAGGAQWTDELRTRARAVRDALAPTAPELGDGPEDAALGRGVAFALDALEGWLALRRSRAGDPVRRWPSMRVVRSVDFAHLVEVERPDRDVPELIVGPLHERRQRLGFALTDRRMNQREVEQEIDYCMFCHDRDKDSCSKGLVDSKTGGYKKNPLGVPLAGCPLEEKISEMHAMRQAGELLAAMALIAVDNPM